MRRHLPLALAAAVLLAGSVGAAATLAAEPRTLHVPADFATLPDAIAASATGDVILLAPGTYPGDVEVPEGKGGITIRGENRNTVVFDGEDTRSDAIEVEADGVTLENMSAHSFVENGFYWDGVQDYAGRYLTVWNVGLYGIYAISSRGGIIEQSYVSGAADAAFYIGECNPCDATVRNVSAVLSAVGYSGTNAGGNLVVEGSTWDRNSVGILPNSFDVGLQPPPQRSAIFRGNTVTGSGTVPTPRGTPLGGFHGIGIGVLGGLENTVTENDVTGSARYGIAVMTAIDLQTSWVPSQNRIMGNRVSGSGIADLALAEGAGAQNCFEANTVGTSAPANLAAGGCSETGTGDATVATQIVLPPPQLLAGLPEAPSYTTMPAPADQPTMPDAPAGPVAGSGPSLVLIGVGAAAAIALLAAAALVLHGRRASQPGAPRS
ncbi:MAG TPA: right-handed parallel beta-helix repeat-containing protein [Candidatus Limnocylindria bacterium]|nr:right-handed parallel beta-helix repeat-containing protein [Candidatus Limnocylindria bacterium]